MVHLSRKTLAGVLLSAVLVAPAAGQTAQTTVTLADGRRIAMTCAGEGNGPTIVFDSGLGMPMTSWNKVLPELGKTTRACAYNRAGYAGSDPGPMPRDAPHVVDDIEAMLTAAKLPGPYVLVAQSLGGHHARLFAARYPDRTAGLVLVDPIADREDRLRASSPAEARIWDDLASNVRQCVGARSRGETWSETDPAHALCGPPPKLPSPPEDIAMARAVVSEYENRNLAPRQIGDARRAPARYPIIVLTADAASRAVGGAPPADEATQAVWVDEHRQIAATSTAGEQRTIPGGSHLMQWDRPEVVIAAVREVVARYRGDGAAAK